MMCVRHKMLLTTRDPIKFVVVLLTVMHNSLSSFHIGVLALMTYVEPMPSFAWPRMLLVLFLTSLSDRQGVILPPKEFTRKQTSAWMLSSTLQCVNNNVFYACPPPKISVFPMFCNN